MIEKFEDSGVKNLSDEARINRLHQAIKSYGVDFSIHEIFETMTKRLEELAVYSETRSKEPGKTELTEHAAMYRRDAARISKMTVE